MKHLVKVCCEDVDCCNKQVQIVMTALNESSASETANHFNLYSPEPCPQCGRNLFYYPDTDETLEHDPEY